MNCKPGDLAVVAKVTWHDIKPFLGRIVTVIRIDERDPYRDSWLTEPELAPGRSVWDAALKPIRDQPGEDEMLRIAGKPSDIKTPEAA